MPTILPIFSDDGALYPDAVPLLVDTCEIECEQNLLQVVLQIGNQGLIVLPPGVPISIYAQEGENRTLLQT